MISVLTYGRNDNYGLNLHKRAALSLNCLAEVLDAPGDEILFADYNTPDELPSFPEAIADTLTRRARAMLRILRIRPHIHRRYAGRTHLPVIEPVARNAALRRSNPANRWILSTNTDMIFVPQAAGGLASVVARLADGYYHLPRFELPQSLWETLDRSEPAIAIAQAAAWARALHLSEVVRNGRDYLIYDGPGDFQLMLRANLLRIHGFDERILLGWHVDGNIGKRLSLIHGPSGDLVFALRGYHCEHTRGLTPKHLAGRPENDYLAVVEQVTTPFIEEQSASFGLAFDAIEEIRPGEGGSAFVQALCPAEEAEAGTLAPLTLEPRLFDRIDYDSRHVLPFLMDALASYPRDLALGWFGAKRTLLARAASAWRALGFKAAIHVAAPAPWLGAALPEGAAWSRPEEMAAGVAACVFDFGWPDDVPLPAEPVPSRPEHIFVLAGLRTFAAAAAARGPGSVPCRVIAVNAANTRFGAALSTHVAVSLSPITTRIRQGFVAPLGSVPRSLLPLMWPGEAGRRFADGSAIVLRENVAGIVCGGPGLDLLPGRYRVSLALDDLEPEAEKGKLTLAVSTGDLLLAECTLEGRERRGANPLPFMLAFGITSELSASCWPLRVEAVLRSSGRVSGSVRAVSLERLSGTPEPQAAEREWLAAMNVGNGAWVSHDWPWGWPRSRPRGRRMLRADTGRAGYVVFGPYVGLLPGAYEVAFTLAAERAAPDGTEPILLDVRAGERCLASRRVAPAAKGRAVWRLPVTVDAALADAEGRMRIEFRVWSDGSLPFAVLAVHTRRLVG